MDAENMHPLHPTKMPLRYSQLVTMQSTIYYCSACKFLVETEELLDHSVDCGGQVTLWNGDAPEF